jgi:hypothetical protein
MPINSATTYDLKVFGAGTFGGGFFAEDKARAKARAIVAETKAQVVEIWQVEHKVWCDVSEITCTCKGVSRRLIQTETIDPSRCPCWSGNEYGCAIHGPLAQVRARATQEATAADAAERPRARLSGLAERGRECLPA